MDTNALIAQVELEQLYQHVFSLEGIRHFHTNPAKLAEAAEYIQKELTGYGLVVREQELPFEGIAKPATFKNIEGILGDEEKPAVLITSHYDTVENSPGANDNASGVAAMLEAARILAKQETREFSIRFVSFTQEEMHPEFFLHAFKKRVALGLVDEQDRFLSNHSQQLMKEIFQQFIRFLSQGKSYAAAGKMVFKEAEKKLTKKEKTYLQFIVEYFKDLDGPADWIGTTAMVGSSYYVKKAMKNEQEIIGVINLETIGYTSKRKHSQIIPSPLFKLFPKYRTRTQRAEGNFISIVSDKQSHPLAKLFCKQCRQPAIQLPYVNFCFPFTFETLAKNLWDSLRSDHAPFLMKGIPAIMLTDTANFRYPFYHTEADTIDKLDFHFIRKVCQATIASAIQFAETSIQKTKEKKRKKRHSKEQ